MLDILGIGELLIDFTSIKNESGEFFKKNAGGAPCNMLSMAQSLGSKTGFIGKVGRDEFGFYLGKVLQEQNIDISGLIYSKEFNTTLAFVHLNEFGDRSFSFYRNYCADIMLKKSEVDLSLVDQTKCVHFGSLSFTDEPGKSAVIHTVEYAKRNGKIISFDPNYRPALWSSKELAIEGMKIGLKYADIIKVSEEEAALLTGEENIYKAAKILHEEGILLVCITLSEKGSFFYHENGQHMVQGFESIAVDTTGAGDIFFGTVIHQILKKECNLKTLKAKDLMDILSFANAAASLCVEKIGGMPSIPSKQEILKRLQTKCEY